MMRDGRLTTRGFNFIKNSRGLTIGEIAKQVGCSYTCVRYWRTKMNAPRLRKKALTQADKQYIKASHHLLSIAHMAEAIGCSISAVKHRKKELGLTRAFNRSTPEVEQYIRQNYLKMSDSKIGEVLGRSRASVEHIRRCLGLIKKEK